MSYPEDNLLPISALQHLAFCERQCALIHVEQVWDENLFTAQGRIMHEKVHSETAERRRDIRVEYGMPIRSLRLGVSGKADVIEFHRTPEGNWQPFPVEYKRGKPKPDNRDAVQLCAQALSLEEMLNAHVPQGAIYYGKEHRRTEVLFDESLRKETEATALRLHQLIAAGKTPPPVYEKKCDTCSLLNICLPRSLQKRPRVEKYIADMLKET